MDKNGGEILWKEIDEFCIGPRAARDGMGILRPDGTALAEIFPPLGTLAREENWLDLKWDKTLYFRDLWRITINGKKSLLLATPEEFAALAEMREKQEIPARVREKVEAALRKRGLIS